MTVVVEELILRGHPIRRIRKSFPAAVEGAAGRRLLSGEQFTVDGTLIEADTFLKSPRKKGGPGAGGGASGGSDRDAGVDFHGKTWLYRGDASARHTLKLLGNGKDGSGGPNLGTKSYPLDPLGMTQVSHVVRDLGVGSDLAGGRLVLSTRTAGGSFAAYASVIDNVTNDPRTLLPR